MALETFQLRGRNYDEVVRQLISTYNVSNGWSLVRVVNRLTSLDVILERNSEQGVSKDTSKAATTEKVVDADATASDELPSTGTTQPLETKEIVEKSVAVKTTRKSASKGQGMYGDLVITLIKNKEGWNGKLPRCNGKEGWEL